MMRASRIFVACKNRQAIAYYALVSSTVTTKLAHRQFRHNMPDPIPVV
ncbi:hypothetical protein [Zymomonas mobilis]|nr:hypothetical protein [Zymomonas mobilis]